MKTLTTLLILISVLFIMLFTNAFTEKNSTDTKISNDSLTFILSGSVSNDHPNLSWNFVSGATLYELRRLPAPYFGFGKEFTMVVQPSSSFLDTEVHGAVLGSGIQQVRYVLDAYYDGYDKENKYFKYLLESAGPVDYTADSID
ncbi:MAG: hypothetical protein WDZ38_01330 [Balneolaceae bacterium]